MDKKNLKQRANGVWKGGKSRLKPSFEGRQYTGGRKKGTPNLVKLEGGNIQNQHGVIFTPEEKKALEQAANTANRKRMKMLENEGNLPRMIGGIETGDKVKSLQLMGRESDFIITRKSKSLQRFKSHAEYERYMKNLERVNSRDYVTERIKLYKRNHMAALDNVFGDDAKDVKMKIRMMKPKEYMELMQKDELLEIGYIYDPSQKSGKLNQIRAALGMKQKEEPIE